MKGFAPGAVLAAALVAWDARAAERPAFRLVRSDEDYRYLGSVSRRTGLDPLRYIPVGDGYVSFGGEARLRLDRVDAPRFGVEGEQADRFGLVRGLVSADLHLNPGLRVYGQLGLHRDIDKSGTPAVTDRDGLDAQVLFVDLAPSARWRLRMGRQELAFSPSQRFVAVREGPNIRQGFDGARLTYAAGNLKVDAFYAHPITLSPGPFNDSHNGGQSFWGLYAAARVGGATSLDVYSLNLNRDGARYGAVIGAERRRSLGARLAGKRGAIDYDVEAVVQRGQFAGADIRAWGGSAGTGFTVAAPWTPRLSLRRDIGSGDDNPSDGRLGTFNPLFPKGAYFGEAGLVSWSNLAAWRLALDLAPTRAISLEVSATDRRRQTGSDAIYLQPYVALASAGGGNHKAVSRDLQADLAWQASRNLKLSLQALHADAGPAVKAAGGRDVDFAMAIVQVRF